MWVAGFGELGDKTVVCTGEWSPDTEAPVRGPTCSAQGEPSLPPRPAPVALSATGVYLHRAEPQQLIHDSSTATPWADMAPRTLGSTAQAALALDSRCRRVRLRRPRRRRCGVGAGGRGRARSPATASARASQRAAPCAPQVPAS